MYAHLPITRFGNDACGIGYTRTALRALTPPLILYIKLFRLAAWLNLYHSFILQYTIPIQYNKKSLNLLHYIQKWKTKCCITCVKLVTRYCFKNIRYSRTIAMTIYMKPFESLLSISVNTCIRTHTTVIMWEIYSFVCIYWL